MNVKTEYAKQRQFWEELQDYIGDTDPNKGSKLLSVTDAMIQDFEKPEPMTDPEIVLYIRKKVCEYFKIPEYYLDENGQEPNCPIVPSTGTPTFNAAELKAGVDIILQSIFADNSYKKVDYVINGNTLPIDTYAMQYDRNINPFVKEGINAIVIQPRRDLDLAQLRVVVQ